MSPVRQPTAPQPSRRRFLKISGATFAAGAAASALPGEALALARAPVAEVGIRRVPTFCGMCFWRCGAIATVRDGKLWKIEGNPLDPAARGLLCTRGTAGVGAHYATDRLQRPLIRTGQRGEEKWKVASWDEALDFVAERLKQAASRHGPETVAMFKHGIGADFVDHTLRAFGTPNIAAPSFAQCRGPRDVGFNLTYGTNPGTPENVDIANCRCLVLIGTHLGENLHNTQVQDFGIAIRNGATIIAVDPRFSPAASKAKYWVPVKPGTDMALLLAWMNVIVREGLHDRAFVAEHGTGFERFAQAIAANTPEWAAAECGVPAELIRTTAREMARARPATIIHPGRRTNWYGDDAQRGRAVALLNALMGNWGRKGGFVIPDFVWLDKYPGLPEYPKSARGKADNPAADGRKRWPFAHLTVTTGLREATITGHPYPVKAWVVHATNLLQALPDRARTIAAIDALDLLVVVDTVPSEIACYADVVLPQATYLERWDSINDSYQRVPFISLRQPVVAPPHEQKEGWWIGRELARRLGLAAYYPWTSIEDYLRKIVEARGLSWQQLRRDGVVTIDRPKMTVEEGAKLEFWTPSGKVEFWSQQLADAGFDPVPRYTRPEQAPPGAYRLITGRAAQHTFSQTVGSPHLAELMPVNALWVNADEAGKLGLISGRKVRLRNQDGVVSDPVEVFATERIRPECVYMVHGFGSTSKAWRSAYRKGASTAQLSTRVKIDPLMGATSIHTNFVTIHPVVRNWI